MDRKELEAWLKTRPREDAILVAQRAALRVFPLYARDRDLTAMPILRSLLTSGVAATYPTPEVRDAAIRAARAAAAAYAAADAAAYAAADAAYAAAAYAAADAAAYAAAYAATATAALWHEVERDVGLLQAGGRLGDTALWAGDVPEWYAREQASTLTNLTLETGEENSFWHRWLEGVRTGNWLDWDLQRRVALIPEDIWAAGPKAVIAEIHGIEREMAEPSLEHSLRELPPAPPSQVQAVRAAMERNRQSLPPTFDAIEGLLLLEIERLQKSNDRDDAWDRQMRIYLALYEAVTCLRATLPAQGPVTEAQAEKSEKLLRLYGRKFSELPVARVDEVVEGVWEAGKGVLKAGLIGTSALLGMSYGLPAYAGIVIGSMIFAPKSAADLIKAAKEALVKP